MDCTGRTVEYRHHRYEILMFRDAPERLAGEDARREEPTQPSGTLPPILDTKRSTEQLRDDAGR